MIDIVGLHATENGQVEEISNIAPFIHRKRWMLRINYIVSSKYKKYCHSQNREFLTPPEGPKPVNPSFPKPPKETPRLTRRQQTSVHRISIIFYSIGIPLSIKTRDWSSGHDHHARPRTFQYSPSLYQS